MPVGSVLAPCLLGGRVVAFTERLESGTAHRCVCHRAAAKRRDPAPTFVSFASESSADHRTVDHGHSPRTRSDRPTTRCPCISPVLAIRPLSAPTGQEFTRRSPNRPKVPGWRNRLTEADARTRTADPFFTSVGSVQTLIGCRRQRARRVGVSRASRLSRTIRSAGTVWPGYSHGSMLHLRRRSPAATMAITATERSRTTAPSR